MTDTVLPSSWRLRRGFWNHLTTFKFGFSKAVPIKPPPPSTPRIGLIPFSAKYPDLPIRRIRVYDSIPPDERIVVKILVTRLQAWLNRVYPAMQPGLPEIAADIDEAMELAITPAHRKRLPPPQRPAAFARPGLPDLGEMATTSPFACFLQRRADGRLVWDLRFLERYEVHPGLHRLGVEVEFELLPDRRLRASAIDCALGRLTRDADRWPDAVRLALCAAATHYCLGRHFCHVHMACANPFAVATRNELPGGHALFRLIWPHIDGTQDSNEVTTYIQLAPDGDFVNMYSFTLAGLCAYLDDAHDAYDMAQVDPELDWRARGLEGLALDAPVQENMRELHAVALRHAERYVNHYYRDDAALASDAAVVRWHAALGAAIPGGVAAFFPQGLTRAGVARLVGGFIHLGAGMHGLLGNAMWNYQPFADKLPLRVYQDGRRLPHDVYQRMINQNFVLNVRRALLLSDYSVVALDDEGARLFRQFRDECQALQDRYSKVAPETWRMVPQDLEISMNGFG